MEDLKLLGVTFQNDGGGKRSWELALRHVLEHTAPDNDGLLPRSSLTTERSGFDALLFQLVGLEGAISPAVDRLAEWVVPSKFNK
ncbi:hypothetical protein AAFF_G00079730 [Aldrovandia affinis]|uniref:Uncharacterized protein n=1 Tax=Aldrovandia affinis TaxID=143900 RepID=A0AAD7RXR2_9TELE|nr:hypothetical protein AAFF_G00079730 [Aldrovandia affinis]